MLARLARSLDGMVSAMAMLLLVLVLLLLLPAASVARSCFCCSQRCQATKLRRHAAVGVLRALHLHNLALFFPLF